LKNSNLEEQFIKMEDEQTRQFKKFLYEDEEIKWYRREESVNLLNLLDPIIIMSITPLTFLLGIFAIFIPSELVITAFIVFIIFDIILIPMALYKYQRKKMRLNLTYRELKQYNEIIMITNKRYIYKSYYYLVRQISNLYDDDAITQINDIIMLDLNFVDYIVINNWFKKIFIFVGSVDNYPDFFIDFNCDKENDIKSVFNILKDLIPLELVESTKSAETYARIRNLN
jgi:hypothetical protein